MVDSVSNSHPYKRREGRLLEKGVIIASQGKKFKVTFLSDGNALKNKDIGLKESELFSLAEKVLKFGKKFLTKKEKSININFRKKIVTRGKNTFSITHYSKEIDPILKSFKKIEIKSYPKDEGKENTLQDEPSIERPREDVLKPLPRKLPQNCAQATFATQSQSAAKAPICVSFAAAAGLETYKKGDILTRDELDEALIEGKHLYDKIPEDEKKQDGYTSFEALEKAQGGVDFKLQGATIDMDINAIGNFKEEFFQLKDKDNLEQNFSKLMLKKHLEPLIQQIPNGEKKAFLFQINHNCYSLVFIKDDVGNLKIIFSNSHSTEQLKFARVAYSLKFEKENNLDDFINYLVYNLRLRESKENILAYYQKQEQQIIADLNFIIKTKEIIPQIS